MTKRQVMLAIAAVALVPALFAIYVSVSYYFALKGGRLPLTDDTEWIWWSVLVSLLLVGSYLAWVAAPRLKALFAGVYLVAMTACLLAIHLWIACANGDCL